MYMVAVEPMIKGGDVRLKPEGVSNQYLHAKRVFALCQGLST